MRKFVGEVTLICDKCGNPTGEEGYKITVSCKPLNHHQIFDVCAHCLEGFEVFKEMKRNRKAQVEEQQ